MSYFYYITLPLYVNCTTMCLIKVFRINDLSENPKYTKKIIRQGWNLTNHKSFVALMNINYVVNSKQKGKQINCRHYYGNKLCASPCRPLFIFIWIEVPSDICFWKTRRLKKTGYLISNSDILMMFLSLTIQTFLNEFH